MPPTLYVLGLFVVLFALLKHTHGVSHDIDFVPEFILRATAQNISQACITRVSVLLNGTSPGPELRLRPGITSWIRVYNDIINQNLTVHWHGLAQAVSPFSDGTPQASQWPIPPMHFFDYELHPEAEDAGTYFYHSHVDFQAVSAAGPLIVEDAGVPPYSYDDERIVFLSDIFNGSDSNITQGLQANPFVWSGETNNVLVNGYGNSAGISSAAINATIPPSPPLMLPNNTAGFLDYALQPYENNNFPSLSEVTRRVTLTVHQIINGGIIWAENGLPWTDAFPQAPYLVSLYEGAYTDNNGASPSYTDAIQNGGMDNATRTFPAKIGEVLEIVIQNTGATNGGLDVHPFHAHGGHFWDIGSGNGTYDLTANEKILAGTQPVKRDTTMLYRYGTTTAPGASAGWRAWRLRVAEPGVWMIHCHTLQHMIMGMQTVWVFGDTEEITKIPYPEVNAYLTYGGEANGNATHDPEVYPYFEP
ncbi:hypothetical protein P7C71_g688, partial [Lecanoromycetidae sp. Uapishka_2]